MRDLNYQLKQLCRKYQEGGFATRRDREYTLSLIADQLHAAGFRHLRADGLKGRHVSALVERWKQEGLNPGTIKNRMSVLRWWASKIGKPSVISRDNAHYRIPVRSYVADKSKAVILQPIDLEAIKDPHVRLSLELQREFGLRRQEAIKFVPVYADQGDRILLKGSWTKGGKPREVPVRTLSQRAVLNQAHRLAGSGSLIPRDRRYVEQLRLYERETAAAGLSKLHGLRHEYAQRRYRELTGWKAPAAGGPRSKDLTVAQKTVDRDARLTISLELGHNREQISVVYCGK